MKIPKAIETLTKLERTLAPTMSADGTDAIKLGIEALKRIQEHPTLGSCFFPHLLPGEDKE